MRRLTILGLGLSMLSAFSHPATGGAIEKPQLPQVVLIGDSIRLGYAPLVAKRLEGRAVVVSLPANGGDSGNVLKNLDGWLKDPRTAVVHLNCGLHDLKLDKKTRQHQVELETYEANLRQIVARIRGRTKAALVFANTTPIVDDRHAKRRASFDRTEADVKRYNTAATAVMRARRVPLNDLHWVVEQGGAEALLAADGTHYTPAGYALLADAVADCILRQLSVSTYRALPKPASGPEAAAEYRRVEAERDRQVPAVYRNLGVAEFAIPQNAEAWNAHRSEVLRRVIESLGDLPPRPSPQRVRRIARELRDGYTLEKIAVHNGMEGEVTALLLVPDGVAKPAPAILWLHSSTPDKTQIVTPNTNGGEEPLGEVFVRQGYVVLAPDAFWHGDRVGTGPSGTAELGRPEQESLLKFHLWMGRTLWGMFVRDDQIALDYLASRPEVDKTRIGATGMSMGSTRAWWLAAVDQRVAATVGVACLTRYQNLIAHGQLPQHGVYYFVNGLLRHFDSEAVLALIAPRPFLALTGELDAGSPVDGIRVIEEKAGGLYQAIGAKDRFRSVLYPEVGHAYTPAMRQETLDWFARWLKPEASGSSAAPSAR